MAEKKRVLFLCTGNSARSQMAEALVNHEMADEWQASSAGTAPTGSVHALAVVAMQELGVDISSQRSKSVTEFRHEEFDVVVTVCGDAARNCPVWLGAGVVKHRALPDPAAASGSADERLAVFREVRDRLRAELQEYLDRSHAHDALPPGDLDDLQLPAPTASDQD